MCFSGKFCKISKNTYFVENFRETPSDVNLNLGIDLCNFQDNDMKIWQLISHEIDLSTTKVFNHEIMKTKWRHTWFFQAQSLSKPQFY